MTAFDPPSEVSADRAMARWRLLGPLEPHVRVRAPHMLDAAPRAMNTFQERAMDLVTGPAARRAFNLDLEPAPLRDAYGRNPLGQNLLLARRLVEAGVRLVTVNAWCGRASSTDVLATQGWDHHGAAIQKCGIFDSGTFGLGFVLPRFDAALAAFLADLHQRGLLESTLVVVVGEFGRSPQISKNPYPGREHWPQCYSALVAGGGIRGGLVHGASDRMGAYPASGKVVPEELAATILRQLGIDPAARFGPDGFSFRASDGEPIGAILG